jgi:hypothetical protein
MVAGKAGRVAGREDDREGTAELLGPEEVRDKDDDGDDDGDGARRRWTTRRATSELYSTPAA